MLNRNQMHLLLDELPETELNVLARIMEGLQATIPPVPQQKFVYDQPQVALASQYSKILRKEETVESGNLLRKVMFTPLSDLLSWVNQSPDPKI